MSRLEIVIEFLGKELTMYIRYEFLREGTHYIYIKYLRLEIWEYVDVSDRELIRSYQRGIGRFNNLTKGTNPTNSSYWCFWGVSPEIIIFRIQFLERRFYAKSTSSVYHFWTSYPKFYIFATNACSVLPFIWKPLRGYEPKRALCANLVK